MASGKKFYKRHSFITLIIALLIAAVAVPTTLALTARQAKKLDVQVEEEVKRRSTVEGQVLGSDGEPIRETMVRLQVFVGGDTDDEKNYRYYETITDTKGRYIFKGIEPGSAKIGRMFRHNDGTAGVPVGLSHSFEIKSDKNFYITLGGKGRPVIGRLVPASGNKDDIDWSKSKSTLDLKAPPFNRRFMKLSPTGAFIMEQNSHIKVLRAMIKFEGGNFYRKDPVKVNPDGTFRIKNVRAGQYMFRVFLPEHKVRGFNLFHNFTVDLMRNGTLAKPLNLGNLIVSHDNYKAPAYIDNRFLDRFELDKDIPVILQAGTVEEPLVVSTKSIRFEKDGELVKASLKVEWESISDAMWQATLKFRSENGSTLARSDVFFKTSKIIERYAGLHSESLHFALGLLSDLSKVKYFLLTIQPVGEQLTAAVQKERDARNAAEAIKQIEVEKPTVQVEGEGAWGEAVEGVLILKGSTTPNAPGLARQPKSPAAALAPRDGDSTFGIRAPASLNKTLALQGKLAASGSEAGLPGALDAERTVAKSPIIYKLRLTQVLEDLQGKVFRHNDTADREILLEAEVLRVFKGDPKAAGQRVVLVWETLRRGSRLYSCLHAEQVVPKHASSGEAVYLMALTPAEPATDAESRPRLKNIFCLDIMGTRVSKADVDPKKWVTAKKPLERLKLELLSALDDPDANTRHSAIKGLRTWDGQKLHEEPPGGPLWKDERAAARILAASRDPDWRVRWVVAWMIPKEAAEEGEKALVRLLSDTHRDVRQVAAFVLRRRGQEDLVKPLLDKPPTDPPPIRNTIPELQGGRQRLDDQEKVILTTQRGEEATGAKRDDRTPAVRPLSEAELDGKEILKKLKSSDAVYEAAFTASGSRPGWPIKKWKFTMLRGKIALEEEVVEIPKPTETTKTSHYGPTQKGRFIAMRSTFYVGPTAQAKYDWVGRIPRYGPLDPWPENGPGPATAGSLNVDDPDAPTYMLHIKRTLWCLGRGYSKYITKIRDVSRQQDGRLKVVADGLNMSLRPGAKWELVIDPDAEYMVRSAELDYRNRRSSYTNSGLKRHGSHCVPEKGECKGAFISASFEFQSASFEADVEFLRRAKATMQPPYLIHTDVSDQRMTPELMIQYDAGEISPQSGKPDWDIGLEDLKQPATAWGEAVEGLAVRLRAKGATTAKRVTLLADARNDGPGTYRGTRSTHGCWLEVDGKWYWRVATRGFVAPMLLKAGDRQLAFTRLRLSSEKSHQWRGGISTNDGLVSPPLTVTVQMHQSDKPLELTPGRHTVRLAFPASRKAYAYSNAVEIEILPAEEKPVVQVEGEEGYGEAVEDAKTSQARAVEPGAKSDVKQDSALQKFIRQYSKQKIVCLDIGEQYTFRSHNGIEKLIRLASVKDYRDTVIRRVRRAEVVVVVNGKTVRLICEPYTMPTVIDGLRIQADTTSGWRNITKRVQLSIWDANDPIVDTRKFCFPIKRYLLFSHGMQAYNEVVHLGHRDGDPKGQTFYHDYGIDVAGYEGREEIVSPVDGRIIEIWPSGDKASSVVVGNDDGLLFSLSHLDSILPSLQEGTRVEKGGKIGMLGKKGASGNFSHLHLGPWLSISALKEKKRCRNLNLYPWLVTTYQAQYGGHLYAIARPHHTVLTGEEVLFDGSKSLAYDAKIVDYRWEFDNGQVVRAVKAEKVFDKPGVYVGTLRVRDEQGNEDVDFCRVKVFTRDAPEDNIATIYMTHTPTLGISEGQEVLFRFWIQGSRKERISIDFGDGATLSDYVSYQEVRHKFDRQGIYIITATANVNGRPIMGKQRVGVESTAGR